LLPFIVRRVSGAIPLLFLLTIMTFALLHMLPGDPAEILLGSAEKDMSPQELQTIRHELGVDRSLPEQYIGWLRQIERGHLGRSYRDGREVSDLISERLGATFALVGSALLIALIAGVGWGVAMVWLHSTSHPKSWGKFLESILASCALILYCLPSFWLAFLLIGWIATTQFPQIKLLGLHPPGESGIDLANLLLPALILASRRTAKFALLVRSSMIAELGKEYVRTAFSKGVPKATVLFKHIGKNSLGPIIALLGLSVPALIGGSVLVETVFAWPGMGRLAVDATFGRNYPVLLGLTLIYGTLVIAANLASDVIHHLVDPRIELGESELAFDRMRG
jgi:peptide/nickel transport system permease protein